MHIFKDIIFTEHLPWLLLFFDYFIFQKIVHRLIYFSEDSSMIWNTSCCFTGRFLIFLYKNLISYVARLFICKFKIRN